MTLPEWAQPLLFITLWAAIGYVVGSLHDLKRKHDATASALAAIANHLRVIEYRITEIEASIESVGKDTSRLVIQSLPYGDPGDAP